MCHVTRLNQVLNNNRRLSVCRDYFVFLLSLDKIWMERFVPSLIAQLLQFFINNISCHDAVNDKLSKSGQLLFSVTNAVTEPLELSIHEQVPRQVCRTHKVSHTCLIGLVFAKPRVHLCTYRVSSAPPPSDSCSSLRFQYSL